MAAYTTVFLCPPGELADGFPDWLPPRARPIRRAVMNPATGERSFVESREPDWPDDMLDLEVEPPEVVEIVGDYGAYLESRLPPFVRSRPHWATKGLTAVELRELCEATGAGGEIDSALYAPPHFGAALLGLPPGLPGRLAALDRGSAAAAWAGAMSRPEHTHSASGRKLSGGWSAADALARLGPLADLAAKAGAGERLYLLIE